MAKFFDRFMTFLPLRRSAKPFSEQGVAGFTAYGGYIQQPETRAKLVGSERWRTASDILTNVSVVAAGLRYFLNLTARPSWKAEPANDSAEAKALAEFAEEIIKGIDTSWTRIVRRSAMFRYHGFGMHEWVAKRRDDGRIGIASIEPRPQHTITRWDVDGNGGVLGVVQTGPQTGEEIYLPRQKLVYLHDDTFTDNPEGLGWFRHMVDTSERLKTFKRLEGFGFERDLSGIPVGRAPIQKINQLVKDGKLTQEQADAMINGLRDFVQMKQKKSDTGLVLDSTVQRAKTDTGEHLSAVMDWGLELLTGDPGSLEELDRAIKRECFDLSLVIGTESLLVGRDGQGSRALSEDKSRNLYMNINSTLEDMAECYDRDLIGPIWAMNGLPDDLRPELRSEDASFKDVEEVAKVLRDMAAAGAVLAPDDPAINDVRDLMGIEHAPEMTPEMMGALGTDPSEGEAEDEIDDGPEGTQAQTGGAA